MNKNIKKLLVFSFILLAVVMISLSVKAATPGVTETTMAEGSYVIGVTRLTPDLTVTAVRMAAAGANDMRVYSATHSGKTDGYPYPNVYYLLYGVWYKLDAADGSLSQVPTSEVLPRDIYYENNMPKAGVTIPTYQGTGTITFMNGDTVLGVVTADIGSTVNAPALPTTAPKGYTYEGWYELVNKTEIKNREEITTEVVGERVGDVSKIAVTKEDQRVAIGYAATVKIEGTAADGLSKTGTGLAGAIYDVTHNPKIHYAITLDATPTTPTTPATTPVFKMTSLAGINVEPRHNGEQSVLDIPENLSLVLAAGNELVFGSNIDVKYVIGVPAVVEENGVVVYTAADGLLDIIEMAQDAVVVKEINDADELADAMAAEKLVNITLSGDVIVSTATKDIEVIGTKVLDLDNNRIAAGTGDITMIYNTSDLTIKNGNIDAKKNGSIMRANLVAIENDGSLTLDKVVIEAEQGIKTVTPEEDETVTSTEVVVKNSIITTSQIAINVEEDRYADVEVIGSTITADTDAIVVAEGNVIVSGMDVTNANGVVTDIKPSTVTAINDAIVATKGNVAVTASAVTATNNAIVAEEGNVTVTSRVLTTALRNGNVTVSTGTANNYLATVTSTNGIAIDSANGKVTVTGVKVDNVDGANGKAEVKYYGSTVKSTKNAGIYFTSANALSVDNGSTVSGLVGIEATAGDIKVENESTVISSGTVEMTERNFDACIADEDTYPKTFIASNYSATSAIFFRIEDKYANVRPSITVDASSTLDSKVYAVRVYDATTITDAAYGEKLKIDISGNVKLGTTTPAKTIRVAYIHLSDVDENEQPIPSTKVNVVKAPVSTPEELEAALKTAKSVNDVIVFANSIMVNRGVLEGAKATLDLNNLTSYGLIVNGNFIVTEDSELVVENGKLSTRNNDIINYGKLTMKEVNIDNYVGSIENATTGTLIINNDESTITLLDNVINHGSLEVTGDIESKGTNVNLFENDKYLTISNGTFKAPTSGSIVVNSQGATTTINGGKFVSAEEWASFVNEGTMTISGSTNIENTKTGTSANLIRNGYINNAPANAPEAKLTITGGTFTGGLNAIYNGLSGNLTITGGIFNNNANYVVNNINTANITGGNFRANGTTAAFGNSGRLTISGANIFLQSAQYAVVRTVASEGTIVNNGNVTMERAGTALYNPVDWE